MEDGRIFPNLDTGRKLHRVHLCHGQLDAGWQDGTGGSSSPCPFRVAIHDYTIMKEKKE